MCLQVYRERFEMKTANRSREELRFVTSPEQIAPYLDELRSDSSSSIGDVDSLQQTDDDSTQYQLAVPMALPPATSATAAATALPNIYEEYVNFIDLSVLNPIVAACDCQRDELIESEISERTHLIFIRPVKWIYWSRSMDGLMSIPQLFHFIDRCVA